MCHGTVTDREVGLYKLQMLFQGDYLSFSMDIRQRKSRIITSFAFQHERLGEYKATLLILNPDSEHRIRHCSLH